MTMPDAAPNHSSPHFTVGLTGGIGSGKSLAADYFAALGVKIIDCDDIARTLLALGAPLCAKVREHFGPDVFVGERLDRAKLAAIIFAQPEQRHWLEQLLHPHIRTSIQRQLAEPSSAPYHMAVIPLLVETAPHPYLDRVCVVDCTTSLQHQRLLSRGLSDAAITQRFAAQATRSERLAAADDILDNQASKSQLQQQITALHQQYIDSAVHRTDCIEGPR